jgi:succinate dehydrogenase/fumarate reductase cytochrome b subunit
MMPTPFLLILILIAGVFAYHASIGLSSGVVRFPVSLFASEEIERKRNQSMFWAVVAVNILAAVGIAAVLLYLFVEGKVG